MNENKKSEYNINGKILKINRKEFIEILEKSVEISEDTSETMRYGLHKLNIRKKLEILKKTSRKKIIH